MAGKSKDSHDSRVVKLALVGGESKPIGTGERTQPLLRGGIAFIETGAGVGPVPKPRVNLTRFHDVFALNGKHIVSR